METSRLHREIDHNLQQADNILLAIHQNPDGDAVGSGLSLVQYLQRNGQKKITLFSLDPAPSQFQFLPGIEKLENDQSIFQYRNFDLAVVLDSGDLHYAGVKDHLQQIKKRPLLINIDHHHTNQIYGDLNLVNPEASSTSEIIYHFFHDLRITINKEIATCLLTGILTDTGTFSNPATNTQSLLSASRLLIEGADLKKVVTHAIKNKRLSTLKLWGKALSRLKKNEKTGFVTTVITQKDMAECQVDEEATEGVSNFLNNLSDAQAVMVLRELPDNQVKGSLRSASDLIDVSKIATMFGGGGHRKAAGFTVKGKLQETKKGWQIV